MSIYAGNLSLIKVLLLLSIFLFQFELLADITLNTSQKYNPDERGSEFIRILEILLKAMSSRAAVAALRTFLSKVSPLWLTLPRLYAA